MKKTTIKGYCDPAFEKVKIAFTDNFKKRKEIGASVCVVVEGKPVVDLWAGYSDNKGKIAWHENTTANIFSSTKGITAMCALRLVDQGKLDLDEKVSTYWPKFRGNGKGSITVRMLLNHQAGMIGLKKRVPYMSLYDWEYMISAFENHKPWWTPGEQHGYHAVSYGWLVGQVIRNISGMKVGEFLKKEICGPLGIDLQIGISDKDLYRTAFLSPKIPPSVHKDMMRFNMSILKEPQGKTVSAFTNPSSIFLGFNSKTWKKSELPAANGQANARSLAKIYGILGNGGTLNNYELLSKDSVAMCSEEESHGRDLVLNVNTRFSLGFMLSQNTKTGSFGPAGCKNFGHPGAGGAFGFADPDAKIGFGYVMNRLDTYILVDPRPKSCIDAIYECL